MLISLNWERFESSLIEVACARRVSMGVPTLRVRDRQPAHELRYLAISAGIGPDHQMPVIGHQAITEDPKRLSLESFLQHPFEGRVIRLLPEQGEARIG